WDNPARVNPGGCGNEPPIAGPLPQGSEEQTSELQSLAYLVCRLLLEKKKNEVAGVRVGQTTNVQGENVRTGVTAIFPHPGNMFQEKVAGAVYVFNAFGLLVGSTQVNEVGQTEPPSLLTN